MNSSVQNCLVCLYSIYSWICCFRFYIHQFCIFRGAGVFGLEFYGINFFFPKHKQARTAKPQDTTQNGRHRRREALRLRPGLRGAPRVLWGRLRRLRWVTLRPRRPPPAPSSILLRRRRRPHLLRPSPIHIHHRPRLARPTLLPLRPPRTLPALLSRPRGLRRILLLPPQRDAPPLHARGRRRPLPIQIPGPRPPPRLRPLSPLRLLQPLHPLVRLPRLPPCRFPPRPRLPPGRQRGSWLLGPVPDLRRGVANALDASAAGNGLRHRREEGAGWDGGGVRAGQVAEDADLSHWASNRGGGVLRWYAKEAGGACSGDAERQAAREPSGKQELVAKAKKCRAEIRAEILSSASCVQALRKKITRFEARIIELS